MSKIGIVTMGTGSYVNFLSSMLDSFAKYFLPQYEKQFIVLTDDKTLTHETISNNIYFPFYEWPYSTLYKNKAINLTKEYFDCDILFWVDADLKCIDYVTSSEDLLPTKEKPICCVNHCGWLHEGKEIKLYPYETNSKSTAFVEDIYKVPYHQACLYGGLYENFFNMSKTIEKNIDIDLSNDIVAIWHDESHLNRYIQDISLKTIPRIYARPEAMGELLPNTKIISILKPNLNEQ